MGERRGGAAHREQARLAHRRPLRRAVQHAARAVAVGSLQHIEQLEPRGRVGERSPAARQLGTRAAVAHRLGHQQRGVRQRGAERGAQRRRAEQRVGRADEAAVARVDAEVGPQRGEAAHAGQHAHAVALGARAAKQHLAHRDAHGRVAVLDHRHPLAAAHLSHHRLGALHVGRAPVVVGLGGIELVEVDQRPADGELEPAPVGAAGLERTEDHVGRTQVDHRLAGEVRHRLEARAEQHELTVRRRSAGVALIKRADVPLLEALAVTWPLAGAGLLSWRLEPAAHLEARGAKCRALRLAQRLLTQRRGEKARESCEQTG